MQKQAGESYTKIERTCKITASRTSKFQLPTSTAQKIRVALRAARRHEAHEGSVENLYVVPSCSAVVGRVLAIVTSGVWAFGVE
jgi:hypothetical protein